MINQVSYKTLRIQRSHWMILYLKRHNFHDLCKYIQIKDAFHSATTGFSILVLRDRRGTSVETFGLIYTKTWSPLLEPFWQRWFVTCGSWLALLPHSEKVEGSQNGNLVFLWPCDEPEGATCLRPMTVIASRKPCNCECRGGASVADGLMDGWFVPRPCKQGTCVFGAWIWVLLDWSLDSSECENKSDMSR